MVETMKNTNAVLDRGVAVLVLAMLSFLPLHAAAQTKIGVVNVARVIEVAPQAQAATTRLEKEFAPRDREILAQQKEVRALEDKLVKNAAVMSDTERQRQEAQIRALRRELRRLTDEFQEDANLRRAQELSKLQTRVGEIIRKMGEDQDYDLIVTADRVIHVGAKVDITDQVIDALKKEFKGN